MADLGLQAHTEKHFAFLVTENNYKCTTSAQYRVRFESQTTFIETEYDGNRSYELRLLIGKTHPNVSVGSPFAIDEILRFRQAPEAKKFSGVQVTSCEVMGSFVEQLAHMLRTYGGDFIAGNEQSFAELAEHRRREAKAYALERDLQNARARADAAWHAKDYPLVIKALKPLRSALTAAEVGKLEYAEKQLRSGETHN